MCGNKAAIGTRSREEQVMAQMGSHKSYEGILCVISEYSNHSCLDDEEFMQLRHLVVGRWSQFCVLNKFSINNAYRALLPKDRVVRWWHLIRRNKASPKAVFVTWLIAHKRLATVD